MISSCASACVSVRTQRKFKEFKFFDQTTIFTSLKRITFFKHNWEKRDGLNRKRFIYEVGNLTGKIGFECNVISF